MEYHKSIALSDKDVLKLVEHKARIVTYSELKNYKTLDELLYPYGAVFLLYETRPNFGHWTAIIRLDENTVEFFDPYGTELDGQLKNIDKDFRKETDQDYPYLTKLFIESPYNLTESEKKFQKLAPGINTCGRWTALRIVFRDLPLKKFAKIFDNSNSDELATYLTLFDLDY